VTDPEKINQALRACVRECFGTTAVLAKIAGYLDELRKREDWDEWEVQLVDKGVRRLLRGTLHTEKSGPRQNDGDYKLA
jgi:hypothetical protein